MASFGEESVNVKHIILSVYLFKGVLNVVKSNEKALNSALMNSNLSYTITDALMGTGVSIFKINQSTTFSINQFFSP